MGRFCRPRPNTAAARFAFGVSEPQTCHVYKGSRRLGWQRWRLRCAVLRDPPMRASLHPQVPPVSSICRSPSRLDCRKFNLNSHRTSHDVLGCSQPCTRRLECGHGCQGYCGQDCICACDAFKEMKLGVENRPQDTTQESRETSLESRLLLSADAPSVMLRTAAGRAAHNTTPSTNSRPSTLRQQQAGASNARRIYAYRANEHAKSLDRQNANNRAVQETSRKRAVIKDVYQQTTIVGDSRVEKGPRLAERIEMPAFASHSTKNSGPPNSGDADKRKSPEQTTIQLSRAQGQIEAAPGFPVSGSRVWVEYGDQPPRRVSP